MKRVMVLAVMVALLVPAASAYEIVIPYFSDGGRLGKEPATVQGMETFVQLVNMTKDTLTLGIRYTDINGISCTPGGNSFEIAPLASWAFRPVAEDTGAERRATDDPATTDRVEGGGPKQPYDWVDGNNTGVDSDKTSFWRDAAGNGGNGGCALFVLPREGDTSVTDYPGYADWPDTETPIFAMLVSYNLYDSFDGVPGGMVTAIKGPKGIE